MNSISPEPIESVSPDVSPDFKAPTATLLEALETMDKLQKGRVLLGWNSTPGQALLAIMLNQLQDLLAEVDSQRLRIERLEWREQYPRGR